MSDRPVLISIIGRGMEPDILAQIYETHQPTQIWLTGGNMGFDLQVAEYALQNHIIFNIHLPCPTHKYVKRWPQYSRRKLYNLLNSCQEVNVFETTCSVEHAQQRYIRMIQLSDYAYIFKRRWWNTAALLDRIGETSCKIIIIDDNCKNIGHQDGDGCEEVKK